MASCVGCGRPLALAALACAGLALSVEGEAREPTVDEGVEGARHTLDYLLIRGNEGGSAGGHAALRFGAETFHFEHADGLLRLGRDDSERFQYVYRSLQNRDIELTRVAVSEQTYALLHDAFERRALVQERQLAIASEMRADVSLLAALRDVRREGGAGEARHDVRGAGFFAAEQHAGASSGIGIDALVALRERIESRHGREFLERRRGEVEQTLAQLSPEPLAIAALELAPDRYPLVPASFSRRCEDGLAARLALALLAQPRALRTEALAADSQPLALEPGDRARLRSAAEALEQNLAQLVASRREDFGFALLLGMARLASFEASLRSGHWVWLDAFPAASAEIAIDSRQRALLPELSAAAQRDFAAARRDFLASADFPEQLWNALEAAAARALELRRAAAGEGSIRVHIGTLVPEARARLGALPRLEADFAALLARAQAAESRYRERLSSLYGYDLVARNCVSEIFRTLETALAGELAASPPGATAADVRGESVRRLGGYVHPVDGLNFIPFVSSLRVRDHWRVAQTVSLPSYRRFRLAEMTRDEPSLLVALRESNVFTARTHQPGDPESFFVFFTDTPVALRPLLGAVNVGAGIARSALGLLELPFDRGRGLRSGLSGVLFSLPEIAFQNIRKGYNDYVPPGQRPPPG